MPTDQQFLDALDVKPLDANIDTSRFDCHEQIDWFLKQAAQPFLEKRLSSVVCWMNGDDLAGYITTSMSIVDLDDGTQRESIGLKVPVLASGFELRRFPSLLIGMLGVCKRYEGKGLGKEMVKYAIGQASHLSMSTGCRFVTVDSDLNDRAVGMYTSIGFARVKRKGERRTVWMFYDLGPVRI